MRAITESRLTSLSIEEVDVLSPLKPVVALGRDSDLCVFSSDCGEQEVGVIALVGDGRQRVEPIDAIAGERDVDASTHLLQELFAATPAKFPAALFRRAKREAPISSIST